MPIFSKSKRAAISKNKSTSKNLQNGLVQLSQHSVLKPLSKSLQQAYFRLATLVSPPTVMALPDTAMAPAPQVHLHKRSTRLALDTLEPRVLLSGDVNPAALTITGEITKPGEQKVYEFNVDQTTRVLMDSLTANQNISWSLSGPTGAVSSHNFYFTDNQNNAPLELTPGKYTLTVDGSADTVGLFGLRLIDAAAAVDLSLGQTTTGQLLRGNDSAVYRFTANAGEKFFYTNVSSGYYNAQWRLVDPYGRPEGGSNWTNGDAGPITLGRTGEYLLVVDGGVTQTTPVDFGFNFQKVVDVT